MLVSFLTVLFWLLSSIFDKSHDDCLQQFVWNWFLDEHSSCKQHNDWAGLGWGYSVTTDSFSTKFEDIFVACVHFPAQKLVEDLKEKPSGVSLQQRFNFLLLLPKILNINIDIESILALLLIFDKLKCIKHNTGHKVVTIGYIFDNESDVTILFDQFD